MNHFIFGKNKILYVIQISTRIAIIPMIPIKNLTFPTIAIKPLSPKSVN